MLRLAILLTLFLTVPRQATSTEAWNGRYVGKNASGENYSILLESTGGGFISGSLAAGDQRYELAGFLEDGVLQAELVSEGDDGEEILLQAELTDTGINAYLFPLDASGEILENARIMLTLKRSESGAVQPGPAAASKPPPAIRRDASLSGSWVGVMFETRTLITIRQEKDGITGEVDAAGYPYQLTGTIRAGRVSGTLLDPQKGGQLPFEAARNGENLDLVLFLPGAESEEARPVTIQFQPAGKEKPAAPARPSDSGFERDPALVGRWVKSQSYTSGDFSAASESVLEIYANGTFAIGGGRVVGGGDAGSFDSGTSDAPQPSGRWRTENRIVLVQDAGSTEWASYARYYVEGNKMMFTFADNSREIWYR